MVVHGHEVFFDDVYTIDDWLNRVCTTLVCHCLIPDFDVVGTEWTHVKVWIETWRTEVVALAVGIEALDEEFLWDEHVFAQGL